MPPELPISKANIKEFRLELGETDLLSERAAAETILELQSQPEPQRVIGAHMKAAKRILPKPLGEYNG